MIDYEDLVKKLREAADEIESMLNQAELETNLYDVEETYTNCTVQLLKNSVTGEISVGW